MNLSFDPPALVVHCDWGKTFEKRWMARAVYSNGKYCAYAPEPVGDLTTLMDRTRTSRVSQDAVLLGFDFPIGFPTKYASAAGIVSFLEFLKSLHSKDEFYSVCLHENEITHRRPFYPFNFTPKGSKKREHLSHKLGLDNFDDLLRRCEWAQSRIPAAGALFWTLGAKAPGRGAIIGWRDVIGPALQKEDVKLWPFDGSLGQLLHPGTIVIAETYPTQYHQWIFDHQVVGKRRSEVRRGEGRHLLGWAESKSVALDPELHNAIQYGFSRGGDDAFDALIGLFGMIEVALGSRPEGGHPNSKLTSIEGWILGR